MHNIARLLVQESEHLLYQLKKFLNNPTGHNYVLIIYSCRIKITNYKNKGLLMAANNESLKDYMHAFASIISMEKEGCGFSLEQGKSVCTFSKEKGWNASHFFKIYEQLLLFIETELLYDSIYDKRLHGFVERQQRILKEIKESHILFEKGVDAASHRRLLRKNLDNIGNHFLYTWGAEDHRIYIDFCRQKKDWYKVTMFDLGGGRYDNPISDGAYPIERCFTKEGLHDFIDLLVQYYRDPSSDDLFEIIYGGKYPVICSNCHPDIMQNTGNCVVKNLLAAIKQDSIIFYKRESLGCEIFRKFYLCLIKASLIKAKEFASPIFDVKLPDIAVITAHIKSSQFAFTGVNGSHILNQSILGGSIRHEYNELCEKLYRKPLEPEYNLGNNRNSLFAGNSSRTAWHDDPALVALAVGGAAIAFTAFAYFATRPTTSKSNSGPRNPAQNSSVQPNSLGYSYKR